MTRREMSACGSTTRTMTAPLRILRPTFRSTYPWAMVAIEQKALGAVCVPVATGRTDSTCRRLPKWQLRTCPQADRACATQHAVPLSASASSMGFRLRILRPSSRMRTALSEQAHHAGAASRHVRSTARRLETGGTASGFPTLAKHIGLEAAVQFAASLGLPMVDDWDAEDDSDVAIAQEADQAEGTDSRSISDLSRPPWPTETVDGNTWAISLVADVLREQWSDDEDDRIKVAKVWPMSSSSMSGRCLTWSRAR